MEAEKDLVATVCPAHCISDELTEDPSHREQSIHGVHIVSHAIDILGRSRATSEIGEKQASHDSRQWYVYSLLREWSTGTAFGWHSQWIELILFIVWRWTDVMLLELPDEAP
jgi:hypothetical protein